MADPMTAQIQPIAWPYKRANYPGSPGYQHNWRITLGDGRSIERHLDLSFSEQADALANAREWLSANYPHAEPEIAPQRRIVYTQNGRGGSIFVDGVDVEEVLDLIGNPWRTSTYRSRSKADVH